MGRTIGDFDLGDMAFWDRPVPERDEDFRILREQAPVHWFDEPGAAGEEVPYKGFWAVARHADVSYVSKEYETFTSTRAVAFPDNELFRQDPFNIARSFIDMDPPEHREYRSIGASWFTPTGVRRFGERVDHIARSVVEDVIENGECDFATDIASKVPFAAVCELMGVPRSWWPKLFGVAALLYGADDPEYVPSYTTRTDAVVTLQRCVEQHGEMMDDLVELKRKQPGDDVTSQLVAAEYKGRPLTRLEFAQWFLLMMVAGLDTTRQALSQGMLALHHNPEQRRLWQDDYEGVAPTAVEEFLRWSTPVAQFRRVATKDTVLGGQEIKQEQTVMLLYASANRDEEVFENPYQLNLLRKPNRHVSFGAPGSVHTCLGNHLGRREIETTMRAVFQRMPDIEVIGEPDWLRSASLNAIKHLPVRFTAQKRELI